MIDLYYWPTPNGHKITLFLEESGLPYTIRPINIGAGDQFKPDFLKISPNNKMPAIVDHAPAGGDEPISVFESGAILLYLAGKSGQFLSSDPRIRIATVEWLFWQTSGFGPMLGQNHHFNHYAPEKIPYAIARYINESRRLYGVLNQRLAGRDFLAGDYSIADMACYPWAALHDGQNIVIDDFPNVGRWLKTIAARPATQRAYALANDINPESGKPLSAEARRHLFGQPEHK
ncbi:MAG: glutathione S-transferase N-terminal domain-containing protein [Xanthomonadaceae bacterium]|jgi:GST-like protein|nr:glutathione S-transferase N-terminal domain-containing protein [Xanthomonadaceae bacterium]